MEDIYLVLNEEGLFSRITKYLICSRFGHNGCCRWNGTWDYRSLMTFITKYCILSISWDGTTTIIIYSDILVFKTIYSFARCLDEIRGTMRDKKSFQLSKMLFRTRFNLGNAKESWKFGNWFNAREVSIQGLEHPWTYNFVQKF